MSGHAISLTGPHACDICNKFFRWKSHLERHRMIHTEERPHKCEKCGWGFVAKCNLVSHMRTHKEADGVSEIQITKVVGGTVGNTTLEGSKKEKHLKYEISNPSAPSSSVTWHVQVLTENDVHKCKLQPQIKKRKLEIYEYRCKICRVLFCNPVDLVKHSMTHPPPEPHKCKLCGKTFMDSMALTDHIGLHTNAEFFRCKICNEFISNPEELARHMTQHCNSHMNIKSDPASGKEIFECELCSIKIPQAPGFSDHVLEHMNQHMLRCGACGKAFSGSTTSQPCPHCSNVPVLAQTDRESLPPQSGREVKGQELKVCVFCNKVFKSKQSLATHIRIHTKEKPYKCAHCDESFRLGDSRVRHERFHTDTFATGKLYSSVVNPAGAELPQDS